MFVYVCCLFVLFIRLVACLPVLLVCPCCVCGRSSACSFVCLVALYLFACLFMCLVVRFPHLFVCVERVAYLLVYLFRLFLPICLSVC